MEEQREEAKRLKEQGNEAFKQKRFHTAINIYTKSLEIHPDPVVFSNRAQAELNADLNLLAQMDCSASIDKDPKISKGFYRRAQAFKAMKLYELAFRDMEKCVQISNDSAMKRLLEELKGKKNEPVVETSAVQRDECMQSTDDLVEIPIEFEDTKVPELPVQKEELPNRKKDLPATPRDFHDFVAAISFLASDPLVLAQYFLKIELKQYGRLFDDLLDDVHVSSVFRALLDHLKAGNPADGIAERLARLSKVSRFDLVITLMDDKDRNVVSDICNFLLPKEAVEVKSIYLC